MTEQIRLIERQLQYLDKMRGYLQYSHNRARLIAGNPDWAALTPEQHESLAAFRVRFSEFQEHLGKVMRAVAIEEEVNAERFGSVLAFMEKIRVLDDAEHWKLIRELRNVVNHEYEEDASKLGEFFTALVGETPVVFGYLQRLVEFCRNTYGIAV